MLIRSINITYEQEHFLNTKCNFVHFLRYWPFVRGIHRSLVNSLHKGQWRRALMFFFYLRLNKLYVKKMSLLICVKIYNYDILLFAFSKQFCIPIAVVANDIHGQEIIPVFSLISNLCLMIYYLIAHVMSMMKWSNGNIFRVTGLLCREFTGPGEFPAQRSVMRIFDVFFDLRLNNDWVNNHEAGDLRRYRAHFDATEMAYFSCGIYKPFWVWSSFRVE